MRRKAASAIGAQDGGRGLERPGDRAREGDDPGALEIEFEDESAPVPLSPAGRARDLRPAALSTLAAAVLGAALWASHGLAAPGTQPQAAGSPSAVPPDFGAFVVTVSYEGSHIVSSERRGIEVDLRVTPVPGASVRIIAYYVSENGLTARADPPPSVAALPAAGADVKLALTVTDCTTVPIGESMGFVDVIAQGPAGVIDRFTILGERYAADLTRLLGQLCPGRPGDAGRSTTAAVVAGS